MAHWQWSEPQRRRRGGRGAPWPHWRPVPDGDRGFRVCAPPHRLCDDSDGRPRAGELRLTSRRIGFRIKAEFPASTRTVTPQIRAARITAGLRRPAARLRRPAAALGFTCPRAGGNGFNAGKPRRPGNRPALTRAAKHQSRPPSAVAVMPAAPWP
jgi:hypothetical protein